MSDTIYRYENGQWSANPEQFDYGVQGDFVSEHTLELEGFSEQASSRHGSVHGCIVSWPATSAGDGRYFVVVDIGLYRDASWFGVICPSIVDVVRLIRELEPVLAEGHRTLAFEEQMEHQKHDDFADYCGPCAARRDLTIALSER